MSKNKNNRVSITFTQGELDVVQQALGAHRPKLISKAVRMAKKHGVNNKGKSHRRLSHAQTAGHKLSDAQKELELRRNLNSIKDMFNKVSKTPTTIQGRCLCGMHLTPVTITDEDLEDIINILKDSK